MITIEIAPEDPRCIPNGIRYLRAWKDYTLFSFPFDEKDCDSKIKAISDCIDWIMKNSEDRRICLKL